MSDRLKFSSQVCHLTNKVGFLSLAFFICVHLGCYIRIPWTGWLINNRNLFLTVSEAGKSKIKKAAGPGSGENTFPDSTHKGSIHDLSTPQRHYLLIMSHWGLGLNI